MKEAKVSYAAKEAVVKYDSDAVKIDDLIKTVRDTQGMGNFDAKIKKK